MVNEQLRQTDDVRSLLRIYGCIAACQHLAAANDVKLTAQYRRALTCRMQLFHFSERGDIEVFEPRPVIVPSPRAPGREWLSGPLVWAIDAWHQPMYLFPRDCPRILLWPRAGTSSEDLRIYWGDRSCRMVAHIESAWFEALSRAALYRYEFPIHAFESLDDAGMWVARAAVEPTGVERIDDLAGALLECEVELRVLPSLAPLKDLWSTSLHVSGIRLRNIKGWSNPASV